MERMSKRLRTSWMTAVAVVVIGSGAAGLLISRSVSHSAGSATLSVNPPVKSGLFYKPTPITVSVGIANVTNLAAFQFAVTWDPTLLQYVTSGQTSGQPQAGATVIGSTGRSPLCSYQTSHAPYTPTPGGPTLTATPTFTPWPPTNTPLPAGSPTATFTASSTPTATPTVYDYLEYACGSLGQLLNPGSPAGPNIGATPSTLLNLTLKPIAANQGSSAITVRDIAVLDPFATPIAATGQNGVILLAGCHDMDADAVITIADLGIVALHYLATQSGPLPAGWSWNQTPPFFGQGVLYDVNQNGLIDIGDLAQIAAGYGQHC